MQEAVDALAGLEEVYAAYAEEDADFDALAKRQAELEDIIHAWDAHNIETTLEKAADALRYISLARKRTLSGPEAFAAIESSCNRLETLLTAS